MDADVAHEDGIVRQSLVDLVRRALRVDRSTVVRSARRDKRIPLLAIAFDLVEPSSAGGDSVAHVSAGIELRQQLAQERAHIRHQAESDRIIARDLVGIDIHMDELGRRNGE